MPEASVLNNRYRIEARLATGGMAVIYRAYDLMLERIVAIKILRSDFSHTPEFHERFRQEARSAANLSHPNIVTIHDFGIVSQPSLMLGPNLPYIVMEYVPGTDLKTLLKQQGRFSIPETIALISQACAGIGYAHRAGLVHCDVKPQNLLVTPESHLKVLDFGIARALATISEDERSDIVWGSPQYFSPEQAAGLAPSPASDVYSLGVILFEMLTGQLPFSGTTPQELAQLHRYAPPPLPRQFNPAIPAPLEQILLKILSKEPTSRYRMADQLGRVLLNYDQSAAWSPEPSPIYPPGSPVHNQANAVLTEPAPLPALQPHPHPNAQTELKTPPAFVHRRASENFDWITWLLVLLALIAAGGLIPFWLWVLYVLNPPL